MIRAICIGEAMVELRPQGPDTFSRSVAGDVYNAAVYMRRCLGETAQVSFLTVVGEDPLSAELMAAFDGERIDTGLVFVEAARLPGLYMIELDGRGERTFLYWRGESAARCWVTALDRAGGAEVLAGADLVMFSGISLAILTPEDRHRALSLLAALKGRVGAIAFDPNVRPALWAGPAEARQSVEAAMSLADIVLASQDDGAWIWGQTDPGLQIERILKFGPGEVVVTLGEGGMQMFAEGKARTAPSPGAAVIDTSGAGDSFNGAYLAARLTGVSPFAAAQAGQALAAKVVTRPGALIAAEISNPERAILPTDAL